MTDDATTPPAPPVLRVVSGDPTPEELAALLAIVGARAGEAAAGAADAAASGAAARSTWNAPARLVRRPVAPGPDGWRRSSLPG